MELTKNQVNRTKGIAILFMLLLHLFCTRNYSGLFQPLIMVGEVPLVYYFALFGDCCVAIYCFCSGYGLFISYKSDKSNYIRNNFIRIFKLYINYWIILFIFVILIGFIMGKSNIYPGSFKTFILTFSAIDTAYNGAFWFITTYIILVLISPSINKIVIKGNSIFIVVVLLAIYLIAYVQRIKGIIVFDNGILSWGIRQATLVGTSLLPYVIG
ncbi:MAG: acyltransferase family protein, partial [Clostridium sp.]